MRQQHERRMFEEVGWTPCSPFWLTCLVLHLLRLRYRAMFPSSAELRAIAQSVDAALAQAKADVAAQAEADVTMDERARGQMGPCPPPPLTGSKKYAKSVKKQCKREADVADRAGNRLSRQMDVAEAKAEAEKAEEHREHVEARPLTEAGRRLVPPHQDIRLDTAADQPLVYNDHPIVKHIFTDDDGKRLLRLLWDGQLSRDAFTQSMNASLTRLWRNPDSAVPFNYFAQANTVMQLAFPYYFNNEKQPSCCALIRVDPSELEKNNMLRPLPKYRVQKTVLRLTQAKYNVQAWKPEEEWPDDWAWLRRRT